MAFPTGVNTDITRAKQFYSQTHEDYLVYFQRGSCSCDLALLTELGDILLSLEYKKEVGDFDEVSKSLYYKMLTLIGGVTANIIGSAYYGNWDGTTLPTELEILASTSVNIIDQADITVPFNGGVGYYFLHNLYRNLTKYLTSTQLPKMRVL